MKNKQKPQKGGFMNSQTERGKIESVLNSRYEFRYNVVMGTIEYRQREGGACIIGDDYHLNSILRVLKHKGYRIGITELRSILISDFTKKFNPFSDYLSELEKWDGTTDYIDQLASSVSTSNDPLWHKAFKKWIVAMVASLMEDKIINHEVLVFVGAQGIGKTTWLINLVPKQLQQYFYTGVIDPTNKDTLIHLSECMLINLDELESLNMKQLGALKDLITKPSIRVRRPYGFNAEYLVRRASFTGSVNQTTFLNDVTGSRRFLCFEVTSINYHHGINLEAVYAQALSLYQAGFKFWFNQGEIDEITKSNEPFRSKSLEEELLDQYFEPSENNDEASYLTTSQILQELVQHNPRLQMNNSSLKRLGSVLHSGKFKNRKKAGKQLWVVKKLTGIAAFTESYN